MQIPKFIWSYWDSADLPDIVQLCVDSWKKHNPDYSVILLNSQTWERFVSKIDLKSLKFNDSAQRFSDFLRLYLLKEYGGVWMDASMICFAPLSSWMDPIVLSENPEYIGFTINHITQDWKYPVCESWFMAVEKNSLFMNEIYEEFVVIFNSFESIDKYFEYLRSFNVNFHNIGDNSYLMLYLSIQKILQKSPNNIKFRIKTIAAEDPKLGPMYYMISPKENADSSFLMNLCTDTGARTTLVKLRSNERSELQTRPELECVLKLQI